MLREQLQAQQAEGKDQSVKHNSLKLDLFKHVTQATQSKAKIAKLELSLAEQTTQIQKLTTQLTQVSETLLSTQASLAQEQ